MGTILPGPPMKLRGLTPASQYSSGYNRKKREKGGKKKEKERKRLVPYKPYGLCGYNVPRLLIYLLTEEKEEEEVGGGGGGRG